MSVRSWSPGKLISVLRGQWQSVANRKSGVAARASQCQNMRFRYGTARTRPGTSAVFPSTGKVSGMFNWIEPNGTNLVLYQDGSNIKSYEQATATAATLFAVPGNTRAPSMAPLDVWAYLCGYDVNGVGTFQAEIFDGANVDKAFRGAPVITGWTTADGGAGQCTQGQHFIGFVYQNRTGYSGIPVTGVSYAITATDNGSPDTVTLPVGHNLQVSQQVTIVSSLGDTAINGTLLVANVSGQSVQFTDTDGNQINGNGAYTGGGIVTNPIQFTTQAGLRQINISVTLPAQSDGGTSANGNVPATLFLIATTASNPNIWYFMPTDFQTGEIGEQPVPLNTPVTLNFVMSLSDFDMTDSLAGDTAQANFLFLAQDANGNGPFNPNFVVAYGQRMCYGAGTSLYVSDINNPQQIAADTNQVIMPNQRTIGYAFPLPGNTALYLTGDKWLGYVTDNSDSPSTWGEPIGVSNQLGAPFPNCVCADTGGPWVWIVTEGGPYFFDGAFENQPLTYLSSGLNEQQQPIGWSRVNWNAAYAIKIVDNVQEFKLYIGVPLDGATECNYMFCIDYRMGKTYDTCDISLDIFNPALFGTIAVVKEVASGLSNVWIGPEAAGNVARFDVTTHNDQGNAINGFWESGLARGNNISSQMIRVGGMVVWARGNVPLDSNGNSTLALTLWGPDHVQSVACPLFSLQGVPAAITEAPGLSFQSRFDLSKIENYTIQIGTNAVDSWLEVSALTAYEKKSLFNR
jgi:hypothetical protein